jgi:mono/diheme cytochrome c family protein
MEKSKKHSGQIAAAFGLLLVRLFFSSSHSLADSQKGSGPQFYIKTPNKTFIFDRAELLSRKELVKVKIENDPAYPNKSMEYLAIPVKPLFNGIPLSKNGILQIHCLDGFSAPLSQEKLLNDSKEKSIAYLAIESGDKPWPPLNSPVDAKTAGPFYLIWVNPKYSAIAREEWPYQLAGFEIKKSWHESFPNISPSDQLAQSHPAVRGFQVFAKNCFTCHTMNLQGESKLGPDLNVPMNPVEYLTKNALKTVIRDPQALRFWPQSKMHGFPKDQLSDSELVDLLAYLTHMSHRKRNQNSNITLSK